MSESRFDLVTRWSYRVGLIGFLCGGGLGTLTASGEADAAAVWVASNAVAYAFQFGGIAAGVALLVGITRPVRTGLCSSAGHPNPT